MNLDFSTKRLTGAALFWMLTEKKCKLVTVERGLHWGNPDALGVMDDRRLVEVEVKISMADFRRNGKKDCVRHLMKSIDPPSLPSLYYFLVPPALVEAVRLELPPYAGLLTVDANGGMYTNYALVVQSVVPCKRMERRRLNTMQMVEMARNQSRAFVSEYLANARWAEVATSAPAKEEE